MFSMKIWMVMRKSQTLQNFNFYTVFAALNSYDYFIKCFTSWQDNAQEYPLLEIV